MMLLRAAVLHAGQRIGAYQRQLMDRARVCGHAPLQRLRLLIFIFLSQALSEVTQRFTMLMYAVSVEVSRSVKAPAGV